MLLQYPDTNHEMTSLCMGHKYMMFVVTTLLKLIVHGEII